MKSHVLVLCMVLPCVFGILDLTYFDALKIKPQASQADVEAAYQKRKQQLGQDESEKSQKKLELLEEAYNVLRSEELRAKYERYGKDNMRHVEKINKENDIRKGPSINVKIPVSIEQIYKGDNITFSITKNVACPHCQGFGSSNPSSMKPCPSCQGKGFTFKLVQVRNGFKERNEFICSHCAGVGKLPGKKCHYCKGNKVISSQEQYTVQLEKGLPNGNRVVLRNAGDEKAVGAPSDIIVKFEQVSGGNWRRVGKDLHYLMEISLQESIFGIERELEHIDGRKLELGIPKGTVITPQYKKVIVGEGIKQKDGSYGNLVVLFRIKLSNFSEDQLDMWDLFFESFQ